MSLTPLTAGQAPEKNRLLSAILTMFRSNDLRFESMLPAIVHQYNRKTNVATVQPLIAWVTVDDQAMERSQYTEVPVLSLGGGGFHISFPIKKGDLGWIHAADRDLSQFRQSLKMSKPNTGRNHRFEDGLFVPDVFRQYNIIGEDTNAMVIQSTDGATRISIRGDNVKITAPSVVTIDAPLSHFTGDVVMDKKLTVATDAIVAGVSVVNHGHISSLPGNRTAGGMIE